MNRLGVRFALAFVAVTLLGVGIVAVFANLSADLNFRRFLQRQARLEESGAAETLAAYYQLKGSWEGLEQALVPPVGMMGRGHGMGGMMRGMMRGGSAWVVADANGRIVYDERMMSDRAVLSADERRRAAPIVVNGATIGYLLLVSQDQMASAAQNFLDDLRLSLLAAALVAGALGIVLGVLLSRTLTAPLAQLAAAARSFAAKDWRQRVPVRGAQEIAETAAAFNQMAEELERQETLRRNMVADIAHELRTPLTVLQGNLRAMLDEVYPLDRSEIATLYDETRLLSRLVDDLRELALADARQLPLNLQSLDVSEVIRRAVANFEIAADAQNVRVKTEEVEHLPIVRADPDRVAQILRNLLTNALRHTPAGGMITVGAGREGEFVRVWVSDTGEGIAPEDLPHVFERFYRADKTRARTSGGAGLGLAIAKALVEAMGGTIGVTSQHGHGSTFWFTLPLKM